MINFEGFLLRPVTQLHGAPHRYWPNTAMITNGGNRSLRCFLCAELEVECNNLAKAVVSARLQASRHQKNEDEGLELHNSFD